MCSLGRALYWMKQLFIIKVNFTKNGYYLSSDHFSTLLQRENPIFSQLYSKKSNCKRVLLLGRDNFRRRGGPKLFARWKNWLGKLIPGLCVSLL